MRVVAQRVSAASVEVDGQAIARIGRGLLLLVGIGRQDDDARLRWMARKVATLRLFPDDEGRFDRTVTDVGGEVLAVSQFTLYGDCRKGRRPSFSGAAAPELAEPLFGRFVAALRDCGLPVATGRFGASMRVASVNEGPVTLLLEQETPPPPPA